MARLFNTTGPCVPDDHFMLPTEPRLPEGRPLIDRKLYFVFHAPRQSGKTTCFELSERSSQTSGARRAA